MMSVLRHKLNQWNIWQRCFLLFSLIASIHLMWYFSLERPLLQHNQALIAQQLEDQQLEQELGVFSQLQSHFVYKNNVGLVHFKQVFQQWLAVAPKLSMTSYADHPVVAVPAGAMQFTRATAALHVVLVNTLQQSSATLVFFGQFSDFVNYLKVVQNNSQPIYFDSIHFNMNRYPNAEITMKIFALGG
jgi:hypothetical protein